MEAIESLKFEHRFIERGLAALETFAANVGEGSAEERAELARFVDFIQNFADALHHGKEEKMLFERLVQAGFSRESGPVAVMLGEHDEGRALVRSLREQAAKPAWTAHERDQVAFLAGEFGSLLRGHIQKEDGILYPMAEQRLSSEILDQLGLEFDVFAKAHEADEQRLTAIGSELIDRYLGEDSEACPPSACNACPGCG